MSVSAQAQSLQACRDIDFVCDTSLHTACSIDYARCVYETSHDIFIDPTLNTYTTYSEAKPVEEHKLWIIVNGRYERLCEYEEPVVYTSAVKTDTGWKIEQGIVPYYVGYNGECVVTPETLVYAQKK